MRYEPSYWALFISWKKKHPHLYNSSRFQCHMVIKYQCNCNLCKNKVFHIIQNETLICVTALRTNDALDLFNSVSVWLTRKEAINLGKHFQILSGTGSAELRTFRSFYSLLMWKQCSNKKHKRETGLESPKPHMPSLWFHTLQRT